MLMQLQERLKSNVGEVGKKEKKDMRNLLIGVLAEVYTYRDLMAVGIRICVLSFQLNFVCNI